MSFGSRVWKIFRNVPDIGIQAADFFVDGISALGDDEFGVVEGFIESWEDNVLGKPSGTGTGERSIIGATLGPQGIVGATVEAVPEGVREAVGSDHWNLMLSGLDFTWTYGVARPVATLATIANINALSFQQSKYLQAIRSGEVDPRVASMNGWLPFNHRTFDPTTWREAWNLTQHRSPGQAATLALNGVNIYSPEELAEFKETNMYYITSGVLDAGLAVAADPTYLGAKAARLRVLNRRARNLYDESGGSITSVGPYLEDGVVRPGLFGERPYMEPFIQTQRPAAQRESIVLRTPSRRDIRIGGEKLHNWILEHEAPALTRLLGGSVTDMLTIPGGRKVGDPGRVRDELFFENYSYKPKWMDDQPSTMDETLTSYVDEAERIKTIFDDELESALNNGDIPLHVIGTGEASLDPKWGLLPENYIWDLNPDSVGTKQWQTFEDSTRAVIDDFQIAFDSFEETLASGDLWTAASFGEGKGLFDGETLERLPEKISHMIQDYGPLAEALDEAGRKANASDPRGLWTVLRSLDEFIEDTLGVYTDRFSIDPTSDLGRALPEQYHLLADDLYSLRGRFRNLLIEKPLAVRAREALKRANEEVPPFDSPTEQLVRNSGFTMALQNLIDSHRSATRTNLVDELNNLIERSLNEIDGSENYAINNLWNALHPGRASAGSRTFRELIERLDEQFPGMGWDDFLDNDYLRDVLRRQAGGDEDAGRPFDWSEFADGWPIEEGRQERWAIYVDQATTVIEDLLDRQRNTAPLRDADTPNPYADFEQRIEQVRQVIEDIVVEGAIERRFDGPEDRVNLWGPEEFAAMQSGFNYLVAATDEMIDDFVRAAVPNELLEMQDIYQDSLASQSALMGLASSMSPDDWNRYVDELYGKDRWAGARGSYHTEKFLDRLTLRLFKELPTWGPFYKALPKDQLWQRAQIYARVANGGPVDSSSWLPYYNLIRLEKGNPAVKAAMTEQAKDFSYIWSLLRDIEAPVIRTRERGVFGSEIRSVYDKDVTVDPIDKSVTEFRTDILNMSYDEPGLIVPTYPRNIDETAKLADEGIDRYIDRGNEPGDQTTYSLPTSMRIRHNQERATVHWHFREIRHARQNILALEEQIRKRKFDEKVRKEDKIYQRDEGFSLLDEAVEILDDPEGPHFDPISKANAERLRLTLKAKEAAHALYIKNYLFSPRALAQMAEVQGKRVIEDLMNEVFEANGMWVQPEAGPNSPAWAWSQLGADVSEEALRQAGDIIENYEHVMFDHTLGREMGLTEFQDMFPSPPPARGFVRESATDLIDFAGFDPNSPYMELIDRISEMDRFPWQAVLGLDDALVGMLVKTYERIPPIGFKEDIATDVLQTRTAPFDDPVPEMLSSPEAHSLVADQIIEAAMAPLNPALAKALPSAPSTRTGVLAKTLFSKSGPLAGPMNSRFVRLFSEKIPHGVINVHDRSTVAGQLEVMFRELGRINLLVPPGMGRRERKATLKNAAPDTPRRLASGEDFTLLDLAIMTYKGTPELPEPAPRNRIEAEQRVDDLMIDFLNSYGDELAVKIDRLNEAALNGAINAVTPHPIFKDVDWGSAGVSAAMKGILRGDIDAAKRLLEDAAEHTERRYGNSDFTEVVIPELGGTTFIYKPMSPSQMRQTLVMPRWDKFERLFQVLQGDIKTIIGPNGENLDVSVSARNAIVRATRREALTMWKRHTLLTPRWQMVVNTDSQLRNVAHLGAAMALGRLGASFDELRVRWLRKAGVDINAVVADKLVEQLPDSLTGAGWVQQVDFYKRSHDEGVVGFERTIEEFVADAIGEEYANKRANIRTLAMTGSGWFFGGPVGAAAAAGLYTTYSRDSLTKLARRQLADTYGVALRAEALDLVERANRLDISEFMRAQYPDIPQYALDEVAEVKSEHWIARDATYNDWINEAGTTESWMYRRLLEDEGLIDAEHIAHRINWQLLQELGARQRGEYYFDKLDHTPASDEALRNLRAITRSRSDGSRGDQFRIEDIRNTEVYTRSSYLTQLIIQHRFNQLADANGVITWERSTRRSSSPSRMPELGFFIRAEDVTQILDTQGSLKNLAEQLQTTIKDRNEVARLLATRAEIVNDYQTKIVGDAKLDPSMEKPISMLEEAGEILSEWGYGSTQVGSTRVDKAFGNTPQQQEIWRRGISANPMARAQLDAEADVQRRFEKFQGAHQYDILNQYEEANFSKAYDDFLIRHVIPQDLDKTNLAQQLWAKVFSETERVGGYDADEIVKWMRANNVQELLPEEWHGFDRGIGDGLYELAVKMGYEANSILPSSVDVFDEARRSLIQGTPISWNVEVAAGIRKLNQRHEDFWILYKQLDKQYRQATGSRYYPDEFFEDLFGPNRIEGPRWVDDSDIRETPFRMSDSGRKWEDVVSWDSIRQNLRGPSTLEIFQHSWNETVAKSVAGESQNVLIARTLSTDIIEQMRRTAVSDSWDNLRSLTDYEKAKRKSDLRGQYTWESNGIGDFGKVVTDSSFIDALQSKNIIDRYKGLLDGIFENLTMVEDYLSRGTLYESIYTREIFENLQLYRLDDAEGVNYRISPEALKGVVNKTRASALQQTKDVLYDLANRSKFEELVGEISPFFGAWQEVTTRWFGIAAENPVFVFRMLKLWTVATAEDENGQSILMVQLPDVFDSEIDTKFFGSHKLFGSLSVASQMPIDLNLRSASLIGGFAGTGPIVSFAASELAIENPDIYESLDFLFPYGLVEGGNALERYAAAHTPSWIKSAASVAGLDTDRRAATAARVLQDILAEQYIQGNVLPNSEAGARRLLDEVERRTKMIYSMRMLRSLAVPVSYQQQSPYWPILSEFWRTEKEYGDEVADLWLMENHPELWSATARRTLADGVIAGSLEGHRYYEDHKAMATEYPELGAFITGEVGAIDVQFAYNKAVAQIERQEGRRDTLTPDDFLHEAGSNLGWREYRVFRNSLTNELNKRMQAGGSGSLNAQSNFDLWNQRRNFVTELSRKNPMWASEFNKIGDPVTQKKILEGFRLIVEDEAFAYRPEIPLIQRYLQLHDGIAQSLLARAAATGNRSYLRLSYTRNQDLSRQWEIGVLQLLTFPDFGNIYDRYFSNIESVNTSNLSQFAPATLRTGD